jgi:hypothetical protein
MTKIIRQLAASRISLRFHICLLVIFCAIGAFGIGFGVTASVLKESLLVAGFIFALLVPYYFVMLYHGVRYDNGIIKWKWQGVSLKDVTEALGEYGVEVNHLPSFDLGDNLLSGLLGILFCILAFIVLVLALILLAWIGINVAGFTVVLIWIPVYVLLKYGVRLALINVRYAKGHVLRSGLIALAHGTCAAAIMGGICYGSEYVVRKIL